MKEPLKGINRISDGGHFILPPLSVILPADGFGVTMKKLFPLALILCAAASHAAAQTPAAPAPPPADPALKAVITAARSTAPVVRVEPFRVVPDEVFNAELKDLDGASFFLSNYRGRVFVLNVWATWCGPCRLEIPELNKLHKEYTARGVEFVGLTTEDPVAEAARVRTFAREFGMKYKLGWGDGKTLQALLAGNYSIPQTFVVAADGRVVTRFRGYSNVLPELMRRSIEKALDPTYEPPAPPAAPAAPTRPAAPAGP